MTVLPTALGDFARRGYGIVDPFLGTAETRSLREQIEDLASWPAARGVLHHFECGASGRQLTRSEDFLPRHTGLRRLLESGAVAAAMQQLFGEPAAVMKENVNSKLPGGGGYAAHQDVPAYPFGDRHITMLLAKQRRSGADG